LRSLNERPRQNVRVCSAKEEEVEGKEGEEVKDKYEEGDNMFTIPAICRSINNVSIQS
jgi:hypothetical protein